MKDVLVYGSRKLGEMLYADAQNHKNFNIVGFVVDASYINGDPHDSGLPLVAFESVEDQYPPEGYDMIVLTASFDKMRFRDSLYNKAVAKGYDLRNYISPSAIVSPDVIIGKNNIIMEMAYLGPSGKLGNSNIIRQMVYIGHDFTIGDKNVFAPKVSVGGDSRIGNSSYIGIGSTILNNKTIGDEALVGGGAVVIKDVEAYSKNVGNPSRCIGYHKETGLEVHL